MINKKEEIQEFLKYISRTGLNWIDNGILEYTQKPYYRISGEILEQIRLISNGTSPELIWKNYHDFFIKISSLGTEFNSRPFLREMFLNSKTQFRKMLIDFTQKLELQYFNFLNFIETYFQVNGTLKFKEDLFNNLYSDFEKDLDQVNQKYIFRVPILNFIFNDIEFKNDIFTIRMVNLDRFETPYYSLPNMTENELPKAFDPINPNFIPSPLDTRFIIDGKGSIAGVFVAYFFEVIIEYFDEEANKILENQRKLQDKLLNDKINFNSNKSKFLDLIRNEKEKGNNFAKLLFFEQHLRNYLDYGLHIFKSGDFKIFNVIQGKNSELKYIFNAPLASLQKDLLPNFNFPYKLSKKEAKDFFEFFIHFQRISYKEQPIFFHALRKFISTIDKIELYDKYFDFYLTLEILIASDFKTSYGKSTAIKNRVRKLLINDKIYSKLSKEITDQLKELRNDVAHDGLASKANIIEMIELFSNTFSKNINEYFLIKELQEFIRRIIWNFWELLEKNNLNENRALQEIHNIK